MLNSELRKKSKLSRKVRENKQINNKYLQLEFWSLLEIRATAVLSLPPVRKFKYFMYNFSWRLPECLQLQDCNGYDNLPKGSYCHLDKNTLCASHGLKVTRKQSVLKKSLRVTLHISRLIMELGHTKRGGGYSSTCPGAKQNISCSEDQRSIHCLVIDIVVWNDHWL